MIIIKILGRGCANCKRLEAMVKQVIEEEGLAADIVKVTEMDEIMKYPILSTPGLVVNEKLVSSGRIPTRAEISEWLVSAPAIG